MPAGQFFDQDAERSPELVPGHVLRDLAVSELCGAVPVTTQCDLVRLVHEVRAPFGRALWGVLQGLSSAGLVKTEDLPYFLHSMWPFTPPESLRRRVRDLEDEVTRLRDAIHQDRLQMLEVLDRVSYRLTERERKRVAAHGPDDSAPEASLDHSLGYRRRFSPQGSSDGVLRRR